MKLEHPERFGTNYGQLTFEDGTADKKTEKGLINGFINCSAKNYFQFSDGLKDVIKKGFKGINLKQDRLMNTELLL